MNILSSEQNSDCTKWCTLKATKQLPSFQVTEQFFVCLNFKLKKRFKVVKHDIITCTQLKHVFPSDVHTHDQMQKMVVSSNERKHPFLLTLRRWGRFAQRNVCDSATEIPYWWRKICPESGQKRWLVNGVVTLF